MKPVTKRIPKRLYIIAAIITVVLLGLITQVNAQNNISNANFQYGQAKGPMGGGNDLDLETLLFVPNSFTPNGDGRNDLFLVRSENVKKFSMVIFDEKGDEIFATTQMDHGWDGKHYNKEMQQTVYLYRVEVTFMNDEHEVQVGHVNLIR